MYPQTWPGERKIREFLFRIGYSTDRCKRGIIATLVSKRDSRKDEFASAIAKAMNTRYGHDANEVQQQLVAAGFMKTLAKRAAAIAEQKGRFSIWSVVDALTQVNREHAFAGSRSEADAK